MGGAAGNAMMPPHSDHEGEERSIYSTVTLFARFRG